MNALESMVGIASRSHFLQRPRRNWRSESSMTTSSQHRFDGQVAVVTGAGAGLGRQHALELARRGAKLVINDVAKAADGSWVAERTASELRALGGEAVADMADVSDEEAVGALIEHAVQAFGAIDILINNAGNAITAPLWKLSTSDMKAVLDVHLWGTFWSMRAALPHMRQRGYGRIVNTASALGAFGAPHSAPYVAAKAGIIGLTRVAALDTAGTDIRVNSIAPIAYTALAKDFFDHHPSVNVEKLSTATVSPVVLYLSHESCELNGELLSVAAGRVARICTITAPGLYSEHLTSEQVADNLATIMDPAGYIVPSKSMDQYKLLKLN
ncbi:MAG: SDR family NAD(P)-dependent oxidoreductase [Proteobacteria bacterium]|nr:SDR family NAD(P)-dependent oxidoreductase [Pseudomonadota bacterium]